ncbi:hypothetical protein AYL99_10805 [Fonsecaea erecta]|uniref:Uncharacterized protein n=1 Tax=Fonsecaea erecta TaxID=1367422 RepID=A0A178Z7T4_9EURO|nr:hypothetical protein AYL99_10805 [Fonsecaea erecta]OAP55105.1 hypothetical protein AYL99_10805 [Fonsecaea erecta]
MSQITVLGFLPSRSADQGVSAIHWAILLTPITEAQQQQRQQDPSAPRPKAKSLFSSSRLLSKSGSNTPPPLETVLYDMHRHQLRQQAFPVPIPVRAAAAEQSKPSPEADVAAETPQETTTDISSDIPNQPFRLALRILLSTHHLPVTKLASRVSTLLYRTPTYGPEEDWLLAALDMLVGSGILEPAQNFDAEGVLAFAGESAKEYLLQVDQGLQREPEVLELDYASHMRNMEQVKAMFGHRTQHVTPPYTPSQTPSPPSVSPTRGVAAADAERRRSSTKSLFHHHHSSKPRSSSSSLTSPSDGPGKAHKFLGFRVSPSPTSYAPRQRWASGEGMRRAFYERQDDPYGGLM